MPGVMSSSTPTRAGSTVSRAACRYSSRRCAERTAPAASARTRTSAARLPVRNLRSVVVAGIAVDRVDVIDAALRRVLDHQRRSLDAEVGGAAVGRRSAPGEVGVVDAAADLR